jgi:hypothetical protein
VSISSCKTPNFTPTWTMSVLLMNTRNILNWMVASIAWTYSALFYSKIMVLLKYCQDLTCLKPDLGQSDSGTSQAMWHKILNAQDFTTRTCSKSILHSPNVSWIQITREARNYEYLLNVNNTQQN